MAYIKEIAIVCATTVTALNIYLNGDGISIAALFGLIGTLVGTEIGKMASAKTAS